MARSQAIWPRSSRISARRRLLANYLSPVDHRIQTFLYDYLQDAPLAKLPAKTFVLDRPGVARALCRCRRRGTSSSPTS